MKQIIFLSIIFSLLVLFFINFSDVECQKSVWDIKQNPFPKAKRVSKTLSFRSAKANGNVTLPDPYQWLQNDGDPDTKKFVTDQKQLTESFMKKCTSAKQIEQSVRDAFNYNQFDDMMFFDDAKVPFWFYNVVQPNEDRKTFYIATPNEMEIAKKTNFANPPGKIYLRESLLSVNGTASIAYFSTSLDRNLIAYMVVEAGSDYGTWYVRRLDSPLAQAKTRPPGGEGRLPDACPYGYQDLKWTIDSKGFFYNSAPPTNDSESKLTVVRYHQTESPYEKDITIVRPDPNPNNFWYIDFSVDGRWLIVYGAVGTDQKSTAYATLLTGQTLTSNMKWISILPTHEFSLFSTVGIVDDHWYVVTDENALDRKMVKVKLDWSEAVQVRNSLSELKGCLNFTDVIPNRPFKQLHFAQPLAKYRALVAYIEDGNYVLYIFDLRTGKELQKILPNEKSSPHSLSSAGPTSNYFTLVYENTVSPVKIYEAYHTNTGVEISLLTAQVIKGSSPDDFVTEQFEAISKDGTKVPYFIVRHKNRPSNTSSVLRLHGYGGYGFIANLYWSQPYFSWLQAKNDRAIVWAGLRGGADRGEEWHIAGKRRNKQKTYDDMIGVAQNLINRKFVNKGQIVLEGDSAGGMMAAAVARQAPPGTFGAVIPAVAILDYLLFYSGPIGADNTDEFGDPTIPVEFDIIEGWDPLRNLSPKVQPPPILLTLADSDDRVQPANSYKLLAQAQYDYPNSPNPLLMYISTSSGHLTDRLTTEMVVALAVHQQCFIELTIGKQGRA